MIRFLFKQPKPRQFEFKPRFYNEQREDLKARTEAIRRELKVSDASGGDALRNRLQKSWRNDSKAKARGRSNRTVMIIAMLLAIFAYFFLYA